MGKRKALAFQVRYRLPLAMIDRIDYDNKHILIYTIKKAPCCGTPEARSIEVRSIHLIVLFAHVNECINGRIFEAVLITFIPQDRNLEMRVGL